MIRPPLRCNMPDLLAHGCVVLITMADLLCHADWTLGQRARKRVQTLGEPRGGQAAPQGRFCHRMEEHGKAGLWSALGRRPEGHVEDEGGSLGGAPGHRGGLGAPAGFFLGQFNLKFDGIGSNNARSTSSG